MLYIYASCIYASCISILPRKQYRWGGSHLPAMAEGSAKACHCIARYYYIERECLTKVETDRDLIARQPEVGFFYFFSYILYSQQDNLYNMNKRFQHKRGKAAEEPRPLCQRMFVLRIWCIPWPLSQHLRQLPRQQLLLPLANHSPRLSLLVESIQAHLSALESLRRLGKLTSSRSNRRTMPSTATTSPCEWVRAEPAARTVHSSTPCQLANQLSKNI